MTGEHSTHGTGEEWMEQSTSPGCLLDLLCWVCPVLLRITMQIQGLQSEINFLLCICSFGLPKKEVPQKLFYSFFSQGTEGPKPCKFGTAKKGKDSSIRGRERSYTHPQGPAQSSKLYRRHPWTITQQLFLAW